MKISIDHGSGQPIYEQIVGEIKLLIARNVLREGVYLPPVRRLAADLGVNFNTVAVAYRTLQADGLVEVRHGTGAAIASTRSGGLSEAELRKPLRAALTSLALSGLRRQQIMRIVKNELEKLATIREWSER